MTPVLVLTNPPRLYAGYRLRQLTVQETRPDTREPRANVVKPMAQKLAVITDFACTGGSNPF